MKIIRTDLNYFEGFYIEAHHHNFLGAIDNGCYMGRVVRGCHKDLPGIDSLDRCRGRNDSSRCRHRKPSPSHRGYHNWHSPHSNRYNCLIPEVRRRANSKGGRGRF